ncbi:MAG: hypothetical protein LBF82_02745 [Lactobacillales bacterium]|jgi:phospholipid N-methyltransferase|nr:hypothetical protein [Lactobacillales bacterium]
MRNKSINRDKLHEEFEELLQRLKPDERVIQVFKLNLQKQIDEREKNKGTVISLLENNLNSVKSKIQRFIERI